MMKRVVSPAVIARIAAAVSGAVVSAPALGAWLALWACFSGSPAARAAGVVEEFTTTALRDSAATTAFWDAETGSLHLHPFVPSTLGVVSPSGGATFDVEVSGGRAYVAAELRFEIHDFRDPQNPLLLGHGPTGSNGFAVAVRGSSAFVATGGGGVRVFDAVDPAEPVQIATIDTPGFDWDVRVWGSYLLVADGTAGLSVFDIADPTAAVHVSTFNTPGSAYGVDSRGSIAVVADDDGLALIDLGDPATPVLRSWLDGSGSISKVSVTGRLACVTETPGTLRIADIADPSAPSWIGHLDALAVPRGLWRSTAISPRSLRRAMWPSTT